MTELFGIALPQKVSNFEKYKRNRVGELQGKHRKIFYGKTCSAVGKKKELRDGHFYRTMKAENDMKQ